MTKDNFIEECGNAAANYQTDPSTAHIQMKALEVTFVNFYENDKECVEAMTKVWKAEAAYVHACFNQASKTAQDPSSSNGLS